MSIALHNLLHNRSYAQQNYITLVYYYVVVTNVYNDHTDAGS